MTIDQPETMTVRWYTRARRFPQLIGRTPDGARLPGGPYTIPQVLAAAGVFIGGAMTRSAWGAWGMVGDTLLLLAIAGGVGFAVGKIPLGGRNPLTACLGAIEAATAPPLGKIAGRPVRVRRPHRLSHRVLAMHPVNGASLDRDVDVDEQGAAEPPIKAPSTTPEHQAGPTPPPAPMPPVVSVPPARRPLTGVQALLAAAQPTSSTTAATIPAPAPRHVNQEA